MAQYKLQCESIEPWKTGSSMAGEDDVGWHGRARIQHEWILAGKLMLTIIIIGHTDPCILGPIISLILQTVK